METKDLELKIEANQVKVKIRNTSTTYEVPNYALYKPTEFLPALIKAHTIYAKPTDIAVYMGLKGFKMYSK